MIFMILVMSCSLKKAKPKPIILSEPKLVAILVDYHLAQGMSSSYIVRQRFKKIKSVSLTDSVLAANGCTRALLDSTISYYSKDVDRFNHLYDKVLNELSKMQAKAKDVGKKPNIVKQKAEKL
jgi:hypothetical protein